MFEAPKYLRLGGPSCECNNRVQYLWGWD